MPTSIYSPEKLDPEALDRYLSEGWRALGQRLYQADYIQIEPGRLSNLIPTRLPLAGHSWGKRQRKLLRDNRRFFRIEYGPACLGPEKDAVNQSYALLHPEKTMEDLRYHLEYEGRAVINTWETRVYLDRRLVAFSFFDLGHEAAYSKAGIYDPALSAFSLGLFTLLLEVDFCKERGLRYFYPGYVSPDTPQFDYKHRIGDLELWNLRTQSWHSQTDFPPGQRDHIQYIHTALRALEAELEAAHWSARRFAYLNSDIRLGDDRQTEFLDAPAVLAVYKDRKTRIWLVTYDLSARQYVLQAATAISYNFHASTDPDWPALPFIASYPQRLGQAHSAAEMAEMIKSYSVGGR